VPCRRYAASKTVLEILGCNAIGIIWWRSEGDGEVIENGIEQLLFIFLTYVHNDNVTETGKLHRSWIDYNHNT